MKKVIMSSSEKEKVIQRYAKRYDEYGYSPKTLGWDKGKQDLRYSILLEEFTLDKKSILDIGCGFGDANKILKQITSEYSYTGIDIVDELLLEAKNNYKDEANISFIHGDFLEKEFTQEYDILLASGIFNFRLEEQDNYEFIESCMKKAFELAKDGIAFDFLSDKVDFKSELTFHSSPSAILDMAYRLSKNVILKNNYMPFEFTIVIFKDESFKVEDTIFTRFKNEKNYYRFH
jgi:SAM-dependent methyltransferase